MKGTVKGTVSRCITWIYIACSSHECEGRSSGTESRSWGDVPGFPISHEHVSEVSDVESGTIRATLNEC